MTLTEDKPVKKTANIYEYQRNYYVENSDKLRETARERSRKKYEDEDFRQQKIIKMRERARIRLQDPEYRAKISYNRRIMYKNDVEYRNKAKENALSRLNNNPEIKDKINQEKRNQYAIGKAKTNAETIKSTVYSDSTELQQITLTNSNDTILSI